jgi:photosynthetic reaction center cytochrome c subunit
VNPSSRRPTGSIATVIVSIALIGSINARGQQPAAAQPPSQEAARPQQPPAPQRPPKPGEKAAEYFKNIKVLKDLPAEELQPTMQFIAASLGVQCNFCHVVGPQGGFDKDEKKQKETARQMMQMVNDINTRQFEGRPQIGCATCHHGRTPPERTPPLAVEMTPAEAARAAQMRAARGGGPGGPGGPPTGMPPGGRGEGRGGRGAEAVAEAPKPTETIDQVVDKYVQALGGHDALAKNTTRVMKGTTTTRDLQTVPVTVQEKSMGQFRLEVATTPNPILRATDGKVAWTKMGTNVRDLEGLRAATATRLADFGLPLQLKQRYQNLSVSRYSNVDGTETILVTGRPSPTTIEQLHFDRQTGLLIRRVILTPTGFGNLLEQVDYSDYRDTSGVKVPFQVRYASWDELLTSKFTDVTFNTPIDEATFAKPAAAR